MRALRRVLTRFFLSCLLFSTTRLVLSSLGGPPSSQEKKILKKVVKKPEKVRTERRGALLLLLLRVGQKIRHGCNEARGEKYRKGSLRYPKTPRGSEEEGEEQERARVTEGRLMRERIT